MTRVTTYCNSVYCRISRAIRADGEYMTRDQVVETSYALARHIGGVLAYTIGDREALDMLAVMNETALDEAKRIRALPEFQAEREALARPRA